MPHDREWRWQTTGLSMGAIALLIFVLGTFALFASQYLLTLAIVSLHFIYLTQSWNLIFGYCGQLALGHCVFYGIAGYFSSKLYVTAGVTPYLGGPMGGLVAATCAVVLGAILFRSKLKGIYLVLVTIATMEIAYAVFNNWKYVGGSMGIYLPLKNAPQDFLFESRVPYYFIALAMVLVMILLTILIERSKLGHRAIAVRENEDAAAASGINCFVIKVKMFVISAFLTGLGGTFYAQFMLYICPETMFGFNIVLLPMLGVIVGGRGTVFGPVVGSLVFSILGELLRRIPFLHGPQVSASTMMFYGMVLTVVALRYHGGLMGLIESWKDKYPAKLGSLFQR